MNHDKYTRRALLSRLGGTAAVTAMSPFVPLLSADAEAADGNIIRYMPWYTPVFPEKNIVSGWMPSAQGALRWRGSFTALNEMSDRMSLIRGLGNKAGYQTGRDGYQMSGGHKPSGLTMLTGRELSKSNTTGTSLEGGFRLGPHSSLDVWMGDKMFADGAPVLRPFYLTGFRNGSQFNNDLVHKSCSFQNGTFLQRSQSPKDIYDDMVDKLKGGGGTTTGNNGYKSAYATVAAELRRVKSKLSAEDSIRLDAHLSEVDLLERSINSTTGGRSCDVPENYANPTERHDRYMAEYFKVIRIAFSCDITRVIGHMDFGHLHTKGYEFVPDGQGDYHGATHDGSAADIRFIQSVAKYRADNFLTLLRELDGVTEANGKTLLDNTIVHWYTEVSRDHDWHDQFNVIAGGGGHFKMGICKVVGDNNKNPSDAGSADKNRSITQYQQNRLLVSIANGMGFNINEFGNPSYNNGPLPSDVLA